MLLYDATCRGQLAGLSHVWQIGAGFYRTLRRQDASFGATNWEGALRWLAMQARDAPIAEIQFWGHGKWGAAKIRDEVLCVESLGRGHRHRPLLDAVKERMGPESLWWFRTCETFGAQAGNRFAQTWANHFACWAAGHTYIVAYWQSGLHMLAPGQSPSWSVREGLARGTPHNPQGALWSRPWSPNTISCLRGTIPPAYRVGS